MRLAQLTGVPIYQVLDNCHATHHVSLALARWVMGTRNGWFSIASIARYCATANGGRWWTN